ncbi:hypothetical protein CY34DRAFT_803960 [Suillus luteus UH-Slu-Lm8-n1]|uniref:Unplaced genomic scaffold CY34scaffold_85, whole genome shotgun sequence n=1 Tax=Suillus luteus UH-Slu-Lm8-n1 TaxID=930992 RepID=A0A0D0A050_9AGAM|nr:hypothetical protein CY34DRAFT_803960 [Suillus luteus UH-Slu-Lm8-n1]
MAQAKFCSTALAFCQLGVGSFKHKPMSTFVSLSRFFTFAGRPRPRSLDFPESALDSSDFDVTEVEHSLSSIEDPKFREHLLSSIEKASPEQLRALVLRLADEIPELQRSLVQSLTSLKALSKEVKEVSHVDTRSDADSNKASFSLESVSTDSGSCSSWKSACSVVNWDINIEDVPDIQSEVSVDVRSCAHWDICVNCGQKFDMNALRGPFECCYHPGFLQKDVERHKRRDPQSYPEDFIWRCCNESNPEGCETGYHIPARDIGLPRLS